MLLVSLRGLGPCAVVTLLLFGGVAGYGLGGHSGTVAILPRATSEVPLSGPGYSIVGSVPVGQCSFSQAYDSGTNEVYVGDGCTDNITVVSGSNNTVTRNITGHPDPYWTLYDPGKSEVWVAETTDSKVDVISDVNHSIVATITIPSPLGLAYDAAQHEIFVSSVNLDQVVVLSDTNNTILTHIGVGGGPGGMAYDSTDGRLFVTNFGTNNVSVVSAATNTVVGTVNVSSAPNDVVWDSSTDQAYIGLSPGVAVVDGSSLATAGDVSGAGISDALLYAPGTGYVFDASPGGNNVSVISDTTNTIVQVVNVSGEPYSLSFNTANSDVYVGTYIGGSLEILGVPGPATFSVTFTESGLPASTSWSVTLDGSPISGSTASLVFHEPNGTYPFTVAALAGYTIAPSSGSVTVSGAAQSQGITFTAVAQPTYPVNFTESGLPSGTSWSVTLGGSTNSGSGGTLGFSEPNGTYPFSVAASGYSAQPSSGNLGVSGSPVTKAVVFTAAVSEEFQATITETGLPAGSNWSVKIGTVTHYATTGAISFQEPNGTYPYTVFSVTSYVPIPSTGSLSVSGADASASVTFYEVFPLTFTESTLPAGTNWSVTLSSSNAVVVQVVGLASTSLTKWSNGGTQIQFTVSNGTLSYSAAASGYQATGSSILESGGSPATQAITFSANGGGSGSASSGLPLWLWAVVGLLIVVVVVAVLVLARRRRSPPPTPPSAGT